LVETTNTLQRMTGPSDTDTDAPANPIEQIRHAMLADVEQISAGVVEAIRAAVPEYATLDLAEQRTSVVEQLRITLSGLVAGRGPTAAERDFAFMLGRTRARDGISVQAVIAAYHIGYRYIWETLQARAREVGAANDPELLRRVDTIWEWVRYGAGAAADGHGDYSRLQDQTRGGALHRLVDLLYGGGGEQPAAADAARQAGLDPARSYRVVLADQAGVSAVAQMNRSLAFRNDGGTAQSVLRGSHAVVIGQSVDGEATVATVRRHLPSSLVAVGVERPGLTGAEASIRDAEDALHYLAAIHGQGTSAAECWYERSWLDILTAGAMDRIADRLQPGLDAVKAHPDLADTAWAYLQHRLSFVQTAQVLHLHPNSVRYRIDRWTELTGWGFDSADDRALTRTAIRAARPI
jgi:PucR C-terminal helix-turn-helix domain